MKSTSHTLFFYTATSIALMTSSFVNAQTLVTAPTLEGGVTAAIGALYLTPSAEGQDYVVTEFISNDSNTTTDQITEVNPGFDFGFEAALGYVFEDTANGIELLYRGIDTSDSDSVEAAENFVLSVPVLPVLGIASAESSLDYELNAVDLMVNQFLDVGTHVQMRFSVGASYLNLEQNQNSHYLGFFAGERAHVVKNNQFSGFGPILALDGRYDFGQGFGLLGGGSLAYYLGDLDSSESVKIESPVNTLSKATIFDGEITDDIDNHAVTNLRANIGIDYVYFFENEDRTTLGIELGYLVDYYADAMQQINIQNSTSNSDFSSISFSGPYLEIKGVF